MMNPLKSEYMKDGLLRKVLWREGDIAIASVHVAEKVVGYEVWRVGSHEAYEVMGRTVEASEMPPPTSEWGRSGWSYDKLEDAQRKARELDEGHNEDGAEEIEGSDGFATAS